MQEQDSRQEKLLALILIETMRDTTQKEKAVRLRTAGFTNTEIAKLLQTSPQVINQILYVARAGQDGKRGERKQKKTRASKKHK